MRIRKPEIERRTVIEAYAKYDCSKKNRPIPAFASWDWSRADPIDQEMRSAHLKVGVPAGYLLWDALEITMSDLLECAIDVNIFPGQSRRLGLVDAGEVARWTPDRCASWHGGITGGQALDETAPLLLRPAVRGEYPARWYVEDGSGRAIAFIANRHTFDSLQTLAIGYLGREPDPSSSFMRENFRELLGGINRGA